VYYGWSSPETLLETGKNISNFVSGLYDLHEMACTKRNELEETTVIKTMRVQPTCTLHIHEAVTMIQRRGYSPHQEIVVSWTQIRIAYIISLTSDLGENNGISPTTIDGKCIRWIRPVPGIRASS
jgi:hypothetical protein